jgi:ankyrin repeat domain-containing protein 17
VVIHEEKAMTRIKYLTPLMRASAVGLAPSVEEFINEGMDINARGPRDSTALMFAAAGGYLDIVKLLVEEGADTEAKEDGGWTALRHAEEDGYEDVVAYLSETSRMQNRRAS